MTQPTEYARVLQTGATCKIYVADVIIQDREWPRWLAQKLADQINERLRETVRPLFYATSGDPRGTLLMLKDLEIRRWSRSDDPEAVALVAALNYRLAVLRRAGQRPDDDPGRLEQRRVEPRVRFLVSFATFDANSRYPGRHDEHCTARQHRAQRRQRLSIVPIVLSTITLSAKDQIRLQSEQECWIDCTPLEFVRFQIRRRDAGLQNLFLDLKVSLSEPPRELPVLRSVS